jgi:hypothetical protein
MWSFSPISELQTQLTIEVCRTVGYANDWTGMCREIVFLALRRRAVPLQCRVTAWREEDNPGNLRIASPRSIPLHECLVARAVQDDVSCRPAYDRRPLIRRPCPS